MSLSMEWSRRIERWRQALPKNFYRPLGAVEMRGFVTQEQLSADEALIRDYRPMPPGTAWGGKWEYGWFAGEVTLPAEVTGRRIVLQVEVGGEGMVFINGKLAGGRDREHSEITLTSSGEPGARYQILVESYAGHGPYVEGGGPVTPHGAQSVPEPGPTQVTVGETTFGIWEEDVYQLWIDVETLFHVRENIDQNSLRVAEIDEALRDFTVIADLEAPYQEMIASVCAARERLKPLLECVNGSTMPTMYTFGHSHIDVAWLWPLAETERKVARTFSTQLALMDEYPEYKFLQSQPHLLRMAKRLYPELYSRIKKAVERGQFMPEGGMWVEADTNITGGESLIRQFIHGKQFFREEFGVESQLLWLPDVFGYSGALPQILRGCGIHYFSTAKIMWIYNGGDPFPFNTFTWEGIDGTGVLAHICNDYNAQTRPSDLIERWNERVQKDGIASRLFPFGHGDGGGGATRSHLEYLRREENLEGVPRSFMTSPVDFFHALENDGLIPDARNVGEIYFQAHRGTYTSQARTKLGNRKSELALREAEMWGAAAIALYGFPYPLAEMDEAWKTVLLNQFHDIIPGSSIHRVYEEAEASYTGVIAIAEETTAKAAATFTDASSGVTVFNSLSWPRRILITLPDGYTSAEDIQGNPIPVQAEKDGVLAEIAVPSCGWATVRPAEAMPSIENSLRVTTTLLENDLLRAEFNQVGEIVSLIDKETGFETTAGPCNSLHMYKDVPTWFDAWDVDSMYSRNPVELSKSADIEVVAEGPLFATLSVTRTLGQSQLTQEITLRRGSRRIDFHTVIDWRESHRLLKVNFPVNIHTNEVISEIQFGHIRRPNHASRLFDADRYEVSQQKWSALAEEGRGFAVLNDCKYGINAAGNSLNLTLLRSPLAPDMTADKGRQEFTYACYIWNGSLLASGVAREGYDLNCPPSVIDGAAEDRSLFLIDQQNIIIETVKPAEDNSGDIIVRLYESMRHATRAVLTTTLPIIHAYQTNMLETPECALEVADGTLRLDFRPFEIKTLRLALK